MAHLRRTIAEAAYVGRGLVRRPLVPLVLATVITVGVTFLATTFSVFAALLWRGTPYGPHERWLLIGESAHWSGRSPSPAIRVDLYAAYQEAHACGRLPVFDGLVPFEERDASLVVDGEPAVIVGVMPTRFRFHQSSELWVAWSQA